MKRSATTCPATLVSEAAAVEGGGGPGVVVGDGVVGGGEGVGLEGAGRDPGIGGGLGIGDGDGLVRGSDYETNAHPYFVVICAAPDHAGGRNCLAPHGDGECVGSRHGGGQRSSAVVDVDPTPQSR